jgi:hypothetical protein
MAPASDSATGKRLLLHAGLPKTGTTSIQQFLARNSSELRERGFFYERIPGRREPNHNLLAMAFRNRVQRIYRPRYGNDHARLQRDSMQAWHDLRTVFDQSGCDTLVVSGEFFTSASTDQLADHLGEMFAGFDVTSIFYLRRPSAHFASVAQQIVKGSNELRYVRRRHRSEMLSAWSGISDVLVRDFTREALIDGDAALDFSTAIGLDTDGLEQPKPRNETISAESMELTLAHRRHHFAGAPPEIMPETRDLLRHLRRFERRFADERSFTRPQLHPELADYLDTDTAELETLDRQFGFRFVGQEPERHRPDDPDLEQRTFTFISEQMPYNTDVRDWMHRRLRRNGVEFPIPDGVD